MMMDFNSVINKKLLQRRDDGAFRSLTITSNLVDFCSNDYLGLARSAELNALIKQATDQSVMLNGATGSRLLSGNSDLSEQLEQNLASIFLSDAALLFNSGYSANLAVLSCIPQKGDTIFLDELAHACMKDGARLSLANRYSFRHNDLADLEKKIRKATGNVYIAVESVYSMDGDQCPLEDLVSLAERHGAYIILDEAHSTGVYGKNGSGLAVNHNLHQKIAVRIYTFGKAMGVHGACVAGSKQLRDYLINFARPFIYTTALPPHSVIAIGCAFDFLSRKMILQSDLEENIKTYLKTSQQLRPSEQKSNSAIQTATFEGNDVTKMIAESLQTHGFDVRPILSPTVQKGKERIRICLHAYNTPKDIMTLVSKLHELETSNRSKK